MEPFDVTLRRSRVSVATGIVAVGVIAIWPHGGGYFLYSLIFGVALFVLLGFVYRAFDSVRVTNEELIVKSLMRTNRIQFRELDEPPFIQWSKGYSVGMRYRPSNRFLRFVAPGFDFSLNIRGWKNMDKLLELLHPREQDGDFSVSRGFWQFH